MTAPLVMPPLGRCICGRVAYTADERGRPMHPCCAEYGEDCPACKASDDAERYWQRFGAERARQALANMGGRGDA